ncbi:hypothetical protein [Blastococcus saxobsidens]|uniref:Uncharacterized protein n=1 Tax=Blastococcus saxobsidens TaxID=138336 RepID=A0A4Q7Y5J2_9ACTN|nr:hypothetical protein [Blastococcus saxobsidens]RZU31898.1 hypothetical protein BKA19_1582 [Blastococcus saxobsidens]
MAGVIRRGVVAGIGGRSVRELALEVVDEYVQAQSTGAVLDRLLDPPPTH